MTNIKYSITKESLHLTLDGHAMYAENGKDIVCSALSTLSCLLLYACTKAEKNGEIANLDVDEMNGYLGIYFDFTNKEKSIRDIATVVIESFQILSKQYEKYIKIIM